MPISAQFARFLEAIDRTLPALEAKAREPRAVERLRRYFSAVSTIPEWVDLLPGVRVDRPLQHGQAGRPHIELHAAPAFGRILKGANKSAKTTWGAVEALLWCQGLHPLRETPVPPVYGRIVTPQLPGPMGNPHSTRQMLQDWCPQQWLEGGAWETAYSPVGNALRFANGSLLEFVSSNQEALEQAGAHGMTFIWFDEEMPEYHFKENRSRLDRPGAGWWLTYVPVGDHPWLEQETRAVLTGERPNTTMREITIYDNIHNLPGGLAHGLEWIEKYSEGFSPHERARRLLGQYVMPEGLVFGECSHTDLTIDDFDFQAPRGGERRSGGSWPGW